MYAKSSDPNAPAGRVPDPNEKLVKVFDSEQESEALVVKGLLDSAGIDSDLTSVDAVQDMFPGVGGMVILVREEDAAQAADDRGISTFSRRRRLPRSTSTTRQPWADRLPVEK